jgi:hypothetical protein
MATPPGPFAVGIVACGATGAGASESGVALTGGAATIWQLEVAGRLEDRVAVAEPGRTGPPQAAVTSNATTDSASAPRLAARRVGVPVAIRPLYISVPHRLSGAMAGWYMGLTVQGADVDGGKRNGLTTAEREELARLRRQVRVLEDERSILKRASTLFAKEMR